MAQIVTIYVSINTVGYQTKACTDSFAGTNARALEEEALKKLDMYESMLLQIAETIKKERVISSFKCLID